MADKATSRVLGTSVAVGGTIGRSSEFRRIEALPRRALDLSSVRDLTEFFRRPGGTMKLRPIQSAALLEAAEQNGLFAPIGVGLGKELICLLLPEVLDAKRAVLLIPSKLKIQVRRETELIYSKHFKLPLDRLTIVTYRELSDRKTDDILEKLNPDVIIANEGHHLRNMLRARASARGRRFLRYMKEHPECRFCILSGTITSRSLNDYAQLLELALRKNSPLPLGYREVQDWAGAIDVKPEYVMQPGALRRFCNEGESVREGYRRRLTETPGVVATNEENEVGAALIVRRYSIPLPDRIQRALAEIKKSFSIEGHQFAQALTKAQTLRTVAAGFYYVWRWPGGVVDTDWLEARAAWTEAVNHKLGRAKRGMDSPALLAEAAERWFKDVKTDKPTWECPAWVRWREEKHKKPPPRDAVWLDDYLCRDAVERARKHAKKAPTIIWYLNRAIGAKLGELSGLEVHGDGTDLVGVERDIVIASIHVHGEGKNLQGHYSRNVITQFPPNGLMAEQLLGRTHRPGQEADEVIVDWAGHTPETEAAMYRAIEDAKYQQETLGVRQKLLYCTRID
jgi:hypothetical protein